MNIGLQLKVKLKFFKDESNKIKKGESIDIPKKSIHYIENDTQRHIFIDKWRIFWRRRHNKNRDIYEENNYYLKNKKIY